MQSGGEHTPSGRDIVESSETGPPMPPPKSAKPVPEIGKIRHEYSALSRKPAHDTALLIRGLASFYRLKSYSSGLSPAPGLPNHQRRVRLLYLHGCQWVRRALTGAQEPHLIVRRAYLGIL